MQALVHIPSRHDVQCRVGSAYAGKLLLLARQFNAACAGDPVTRRCHSCDTLVSSQAFHRTDTFTTFVVGESVLGWPKAYAALKEACTFQPVQSMTRRRLSHLTLSAQHSVMPTWPSNSTEV